MIPPEAVDLIKRRRLLGYRGDEQATETPAA
jgi:hypothetical protein